MKVDRVAILKKLEVAAKVCPSTTPKDILKFVKLVFDGEKLSVIATDCEVGARLVIPGGVDGNPVTMVIPANQSVHVLRELTSDIVDLDWDGGSHAVIRGGRDTIKVNAWNRADEFPEWSHEGKEYIIKSDAFLSAVGRCIYAADRDNGGYAIKSVHLKIGGGLLTVQATDTRKAAFEAIDCIGPSASLLIPPKAISVLSSAISGDFSLSVGTSGVEFISPCETVYSRQVEGKFPPLERVVDSLCNTKRTGITVSAGELAKFVRKAMLATDVEAGGIEVRLANQSLSASSRSEAKGAAEVEMHVDTDETARVSVRAEYLKEMLSVLRPSDLLVWEISANDPNVFRAGEWTGILMPLVGE